MALPTSGNETLSICAYSAEGAGRCLGLSEAETLIVDPEQRAALKSAGEKILNATKALFALHIARITLEFVDNRVALGKGTAIDKAFDRFNTFASETIRSGVAGGNRAHPAYTKVYETGSPAPFQQPTIREDPALCEDLEKRFGTLPDNFDKKPGLLGRISRS